MTKSTYLPRLFFPVMVLLMLFGLTPVAIADNAQAAIEFESITHDFGVIKADDGKVTCQYKFTNTGNAPLAIIEVTNGGCGCTKPSYPQQPIAPGASGTITITFDPKAYRGEISRTVRVTTNGKPKRVRLNFKADIIPVNKK